MANSAIVKAWFKKAIQDLKVARFLLSSQDDDFLGGIAFNCQQCIEKSIKGFLTSKKVRFNKTHDLRELVQQAIEAEPKLENLKNQKTEFETISKYAVAYRYADAAEKLEPLTREKAVEALKLAEACFAEFSKLCDSGD